MDAGREGLEVPSLHGPASEVGCVQVRSEGNEFWSRHFAMASAAVQGSSWAQVVETSRLGREMLNVLYLLSLPSLSQCAIRNLCTITLQRFVGEICLLRC